MGHKRARTGEVREDIDDEAASRKKVPQKRMQSAPATSCTKFRPQANTDRRDPDRASNPRTRPAKPGRPQLPSGAGQGGRQQSAPLPICGARRPPAAAPPTRRLLSYWVRLLATPRPTAAP